MELVFPDVAVEAFDFSAEWLITAMNADNKQVHFEGQGRNSDLEMVLDFKEILYDRTRIKTWENS